jgi:hypothetical protein
MLSLLLSSENSAGEDQQSFNKIFMELNSCIWFRSGSAINLGMIMINIKPTPHFGKLFFFLPMVAAMDNLAIKTPNPKCRLYLCNRVYGLEIQSVMLVFSTGFVNYCPSNLLSG